MPNPNFPNNPGYNLYVGARYVPKFSDVNDGQWTNTVEYEPLTIVLYQGNSYTSKTYVPVGADIANDTYWALTGNYNAQLAYLTTQFNAFKDGALTANVVDYGADSTGVTDSTSAFNSALNSGKPYIYIPDGTFLINGTVSIPKDTTIICFGTVKVTTNISSTSLYGVFVVAGDNVVIDGLKIEETGNSIIQNSALIYAVNVDNLTIINSRIDNINESYAIALKNCTNSTIQSNYINNFQYCGIILLDACENIVIKNNSVSEPRSYISNNQYAIVLSSTLETSGGTDSKNVICDGNFCYATYSSWEGIDSHGGRNLTVVNNIVEGFEKAISLGAMPLAGLDGSNFIIANNTIIDAESTNGASAPASVNAITVGSISNGTGVKNVDIHDNLIINFGQNYTGTSNYNCVAIYVIDNSGNMQNLKIHDNVLLNCRNGGIGGSGLNEAEIYNNVIELEGDTNNFGIVLYTAVRFNDVVIRNNKIKAFRPGFGPTGTFSTVPHIVYKDNDVDCTDEQLVTYNDSTVPQYCGTGNLPTKGKRGDKVYIWPPTSGSPEYYVCTSDAIVGVNAVWTAGPSLA